MERIGTLTSENGVSDVFFQDGLFTLGASEQVTPAQLLAWGGEGKLRWEREGMAEWVKAYVAEAPLSPAASRSTGRPVLLAAVAAVIVLLVFGVAGTALGRQALARDRARSERQLETAKSDADTAERKAMMLGEEIQRVAETRGKTTPEPEPEPEPSPKPAPQPEPQPQPVFSEHCRIKAWYTGGGFSSETAWVHFKTVDAQGKTVKEVLGSDQMNIRKEQNAMAETSKRRQLVDSLRHTMTSAGWTEVGVAEGGEWYEYVFGRGGGD